VLNLLRGGSGLYLVRVRGGRGMRNSLCGYLSVEPKHMNLISSKIAKHVDVLKLFASIALRTVSLQQLLNYDVTTDCCETLSSDSCHVAEVLGLKFFRVRLQS